MHVNKWIDSCEIGPVSEFKENRANIGICHKDDKDGLKIKLKGMMVTKEQTWGHGTREVDFQPTPAIVSRLKRLVQHLKNETEHALSDVAKAKDFRFLMSTSLDHEHLSFLNSKCTDNCSLTTIHKGQVVDVELTLTSIKIVKCGNDMMYVGRIEYTVSNLEINPRRPGRMWFFCSPAASEPPLCASCFRHPPTVVFLPFRHQRLCKECAAKVEMCPTCKTPINEKIDPIQ